MSVARAVCRGVPCLLETNILLLPRSRNRTSSSAKSILSIEKQNRETVGSEGVGHYISYPPPQAVDGHPETFFESFQGLDPQLSRWRPDYILMSLFSSTSDAKDGDYVSLDVLQVVEPALEERSSLEMWWLIDDATEQILLASEFGTSNNGEMWVSSPH